MSNQKQRVVILTRAPSENNKNKIYLSNKEFLSLIDADKQNMIFQYYDNKSNVYFYIVKEGFYFYTNSFHLDSFEVFYDTVKLAREKEFWDLDRYYHSQELGIENGGDYSDFIHSDFFYNDNYDSQKGKDKINKDRFKEFIEARDRGFTSLKDYHDAKELGIRNYESYEGFRESGFMEGYRGSDGKKKSYSKFLEAKEKGFTDIYDFEFAKELNIEKYDELETFKQSGFFRENSRHKEDNYKEFKEAKNLGFNYYEDYSKALDLDLENFNEYKQFLDSGCQTVEEYHFKIKFPPIFKEMSKKINEILKDAKEAFDSMRYEEFIRLKYLSAEKLVELAYMKVFKKDFKEENNLNFDDIIRSIEEKTNKKVVDFEELRYWRRLRNKIIHEHYKIEKNKAEKCNEFIDEFYNNLNEIVKKL